MFGSLTQLIVRQSIISYGPGRLYRDLMRVNRKNIVDHEMRYNINKTIMFFLRNKEVTVEEIIRNENIRYLMRHAEADLRKNKVISNLYPKK